MKPAASKLVTPIGEVTSAPAQARVVITAPMPATRRLYVLKADIAKYGATDECPGCVSVSVSGSASVPHNQMCRDRITELVAREDDEKSRSRLRRVKPDVVPQEMRPDPAVGEVIAGEAAGDPLG